MRWPWRRRERPDDDTAEAVLARRRAEAKLDDVRRRQQEIEDVTEQLRRLRARNRFAEMIVETLRPPPPEKPR